MFKGTYTALVTPMCSGKVDADAFQQLIETQISAGVDGIVPVGTTGESPTLTHEEHHQVVELATRFANGRCRVIAGAGSNATAEAISLTRGAEKQGVDGVLIVAPYYNKPSQEGLFRHYRAIAEATSLKLVLYSVPSRCGVEIGVQTVARLAEACPNIVAIKEAGGSVERVSQLRIALPEEFSILSGDDSMTLPFMSVGAVGVISVASNLIPGEVSQLVKAALDGDFRQAQVLHQKYYPLFKGLFIESNPVPVKAALALQGAMTSEIRLPLCEMSAANLEVLRGTLKNLALLD